MKTRLFGLLLFLAFLGDALACPGCTYERMLNKDFFQITFFTKVIAAVLLTANRMDVVRLLYAFMLYVGLVLYYYVRLIWLPGGPFIHLLFSSGVIDAAVLYGLGQIRFFRRHKDKGLMLWQPIAYTIIVSLAWWMFL